MQLTEQEKKLVAYFRKMQATHEGRPFTLLVTGVPFADTHIAQTLHGVAVKPTALSIELFDAMQKMKSGPHQTTRYLIYYDPPNDVTALTFIHDPNPENSDS